MVAPRIDIESVGVPEVVATLQPGTYRYKAAIEVGGQKIGLSLTIEVQDSADGYQVTESTESPMGQSTDKATLEKKSLIVLHRNLSQDETVIDADLTGKDVFADGPGSWLAIACLPLAEGYTAMYRTYDLQQEKMKPMRMTVTGRDGANRKVEVAPADGSAGQTTLWIDPARRLPVKVQSVLPELGGAIMTSELVG